MHFVGVLRAAFAETDDVVVTLSGSRQVLFIDAAGEIAAGFGGSGPGPGEFQAMSDLFAIGDEFAVWDVRNRRLSFFGARASAEEFRVDLPRRHDLVGLLADDTLVTTPGRTRMWARRARRSGNLDGLVLEGDARPFHLRNREGEELRVLFGPKEPPMAALGLSRPGDDGDLPATGFHMGSSCLPELRWATSSDAVVVLDSDRSVLFHLRRSGVDTVLVRAPPRDRITRDFVNMVEGWMDRAEDEMGGIAAASRRAVRDRIGEPGDPIPSTWSAMLVDPADRIWLRRAWCATSSPPERWEVVGTDGEIVGRVTLPPETRLLAVGHERLLLQAADDLGVQRLVMYRFGDT